MPLPERLIVPVNVSRGTLQYPVPDELEGVTNGTLANIIRQLSSLSRHAEEMFGNLFNEAEEIANRSSHLQARIDKLAVRVTQLDSTVEEVQLQDIHLQNAFKSSTSFDQQVVSRATMPKAMQELYEACDRPPPLDKLNPYRDDGKDGLKFYTDPNYFFELWSQEMVKDTEKRMLDKGKKGHGQGGHGKGDRSKKRVRQPGSTVDKQRQKAIGNGEYLIQNEFEQQQHGGVAQPDGYYGQQGAMQPQFQGQPGMPQQPMMGMNQYGMQPQNPSLFPQQPQMGGQANNMGAPPHGMGGYPGYTHQQEEPIYTPRILRNDHEPSHPTSLPQMQYPNYQDNIYQGYTGPRTDVNQPPTTLGMGAAPNPMSPPSGGLGTPTRRPNQPPPAPPPEDSPTKRNNRDSLPPPPAPPAANQSNISAGGSSSALGDFNPHQMLMNGITSSPLHQRLGGHTQDPGEHLPPPPPVPSTTGATVSAIEGLLNARPTHDFAAPSPPPPPMSEPPASIEPKPVSKPPAPASNIPAPPPPPPPPPAPGMLTNGKPNGGGFLKNKSPVKANGDAPLLIAPKKKAVPAQDGVRSDLLKAIRDGINLRRVENNGGGPVKETEKSNGDSSSGKDEGGKASNGNGTSAKAKSDVASILARRVAVEMSDSDAAASDSEYDSDDWGDESTA